MSPSSPGRPAALGEAGATVIWRDALLPDRGEGRPTAPGGFASSESPRYVGRAVAALAADPDRVRWNQRSVSSAQLAREYGFTDIDGTRPDSWAAT